MRRNGFTLIELITVLAMVGVMLAIAIPRMRVSPLRRAGSAGRQLVADLDLARTRALAAKKTVRVTFDVAGNKYEAYLDDGNGIQETVAEMRALRGFDRRELHASVTYGRGSAGPIPGETGIGAVTLDNELVEFDGRGMTTPFGSRGSVYIVSRDDANAVSAVSVSSSGSFKVWVYRGGQWQ